MIRPKHFTRLLEQAKGTPYAAMIHTPGAAHRRSQAVYSPENLGHFGLALQRYCALHLADPALFRPAGASRADRRLRLRRGRLAAGRGGDVRGNSAQHISATERRAAAAERDAIDRYVAPSCRSGWARIFDGRINGVTRFGLFVTLDETGADGLLPVSTLPSGFLRP